MSHRIALTLAGLPYTLLKGAIYIHPTLAEGFFSLMERSSPPSNSNATKIFAIFRVFAPS